MARYRNKSQRVITQVFRSDWHYEHTPEAFNDKNRHYHDPIGPKLNPTHWTADVLKVERTDNTDGRRHPLERNVYQDHETMGRHYSAHQLCETTTWSESTPGTLEVMTAEYKHLQGLESKTETTAVSI